MAMSYKTYWLRQAARELAPVVEGVAPKVMAERRKAFAALWKSFQLCWNPNAGEPSLELEHFLHRLEWYNRYLNPKEKP